MNDTDEKIRMHLTRKEKTLEILKLNKTGLDKSLNNMEEYLSNNNFKSRTVSPGFRNVNRTSG
jgi:hypothetical protein